MGADPKKLARPRQRAAEFNPMLGFRGCRIAIAYPEIAEMQARAIFEAAVEAGKRTGKPVVPEVMVPLIATKAELDIVKARIDAMAEAVTKETGVKLELSGRHHDRTAARGADGRRDRAERGVLLVRHQRPDADHVRHQPRRRGELPRHLYRARHPPGRSVRRRSTARASASWCGSASSAAARSRNEPQGRHLRRARRRSGFGRVLPRDRARLRVLLAVPRADRAARRRAGGAGQEGRGARHERHANAGSATPTLRSKSLSKGRDRRSFCCRRWRAIPRTTTRSAEGLAAAGSAHASAAAGIGKTGPLTGISLHDFAQDIAEVIKALGGGRP